MRRQLFLASVGAIALMGTAYAADLAPPPPPPPPAPIFSWTGLYLGAQVGGAWANDPTSVLFLKSRLRGPRRVHQQFVRR